MSVTRSIHIFVCFVSLVLFSGCASVEPDKIPINAIEMTGVVSDISSVPYSGLDKGQRASVLVAGGISGVLLAGAIESQRGNRGVSSIAVRVSPKLALTVPVNGSFKQGECVRLFIDPIYKDLLLRDNVPVMSMAVGSTLVKRVACLG